MQLLIKHNTDEGLELPINYHHILQGIIYRNLDSSFGYSNYIHQQGTGYGERNYKFFTFSLIQGKYEIKDKRIFFRHDVSFEVRSPDTFLLKMLGENVGRKGIRYGKQYYPDVDIYYSDACIESDELYIKMISPLSIHSTDMNTNKVHFYSPDERDFQHMVNDNFIRKYHAYYGIVPESSILVRPVNVTERDKYVTRYKNFMISGWLGEYYLAGERKYLDFLYHVGLGSRNSQGFGLFDIMNG